MITALNTTYHEMAKHHYVAILLARVREIKDKLNVEVSVFCHCYFPFFCERHQCVMKQ